MTAGRVWRRTVAPIVAFWSAFVCAGVVFIGDLAGAGKVVVALIGVANIVVFTRGVSDGR